MIQYEKTGLRMCTKYSTLIYIIPLSNVLIWYLFIIVGVYDSHVILLCYYRTPVDRDYNKMTEQDCSQVVTHYGGNNCRDAPILLA